MTNSCRDLLLALFPPHELFTYQIWLIQTIPSNKHYHTVSLPVQHAALHPSSSSKRKHLSSARGLNTCSTIITHNFYSHSTRQALTVSVQDCSFYRHCQGEVLTSWLLAWSNHTQWQMPNVHITHASYKRIITHGISPIWFHCQAATPGIDDDWFNTSWCWSIWDHVMLVTANSEHNGKARWSSVGEASQVAPIKVLLSLIAPFSVHRTSSSIS